MISVIVPVYNMENYLRECLDSLVNQTFKDIEIILVDDGSTDSSNQICQEYVNKYSNVVLLTKENEGQQSAWMMGVEHSHGEYIGFVDSDDYADITMYEKLYKCAIKTDADIVMCTLRIFSSNKEEYRTYDLKPYYGKEDIHEIHDRVFSSLKGGGISIARWNKLFKREIFIPNVKYCVDKSRHCEDRFIVPACLFTAKTFAYVDEPLYNYRLVKNSSSRKPQKLLYGIIENLYRRQTEMLKDKGIYEKYSKQLDVAKIDYIRIIVVRNLCSNISIKERYRMARELLTNPVNKRCVLKNKSECVYKFGKFIYLCFKLNSAAIMVFGAAIFKLFLVKKNSYK